MSAVIRHRPEIDGLRAIAVIAVIIFHLNAEWLPGGFAGVDVFFALSGFLITSIIVREKDAGIFSFSSFYIRRMKRILPPLYAMVAVVVVAGVFLLTGKDFRYLKESVEYLVLFCSNVYFGKGGDYFGPQSAEMPLLHTWSLAVEEQFYFFWPVLIGAFYRYRGAWKRIFFILLVVASFCFAEYLLRILNNKPLAYYSLLSRYGEMLIGAGVAILMAKSDSRLNHLGRTASSLACFSGLAMLLWSFIFLSESSLFPGMNSMPSVAGTLMLIIGTTGFKGVFVKALSSPAVNHLGKISYSLYLWHWPILAYMRYVYGGRELPGVWIVIAVFATYAISVLSYYTIEQSVRNLKMSFARAFVFCLLLPSIVIFGCLKGTNALSYLHNQDAKLTTYGGDEVCHLKFGGQCVRGESSKEPNILVFGDSHAAHLHYFLDKLGKLNGWSAMLISASSCGPAFGFNSDYLIVSSRKNCQTLLEYVEKNYSAYDIVAIAARWDFQFGIEPSEYKDPDFVDKFEKTLNVLRKGGKRVILISQVPALTSDPFRVEKALKLHIPVEVRYSKYTDPANALLRQIAERHGIEVMEINSIVKRLEGGFYLNGHSVYMDNNHLNQLGSAGLGEIYFKGQNLLR